MFWEGIKECVLPESNHFNCQGLLQPSSSLLMSIILLHYTDWQLGRMASERAPLYFHPTAKELHPTSTPIRWTGEGDRLSVKHNLRWMSLSLVNDSTKEDGEGEIRNWATRELNPTSNPFTNWEGWQISFVKINPRKIRPWIEWEEIGSPGSTIISFFFFISAQLKLTASFGKAGLIKTRSYKSGEGDKRK